MNVVIVKVLLKFQNFKRLREVKTLQITPKKPF
jgi:hypothetical protein